MRAPGNPSTIHYFTCGQIGHRVAECPNSTKRPNKGRGLLIEAEDPNIDSHQPNYEDDGELQGEEDGFIYGDVGENLMLRKALIAPKLHLETKD